MSDPIVDFKNGLADAVEKKASTAHNALQMAESEIERLERENETLKRELAEAKADLATAYGYLWHVNNEPGTPQQYPPERAAYEARKLLRERLTQSQRGEAINRVKGLIANAIERGE